MGDSTALSLGYHSSAVRINEWTDKNLKSGPQPNLYRTGSTELMGAGIHNAKIKY